MTNTYDTARPSRPPRFYIPDPPEEFPVHMLCSPEPLWYGSETIQRYVNILMDKWFRAIFGAEKNKEVLMGIIRELIPERRVVDISYGRKPMRKSSPFKECHDAYFDVECTDDEGARFIVEMQVREQDHFRERALFYSTFPIQEQVLARNKNRGRLSHDLHFDYPPVYVISFLRFSFHPLSDKILYRFDLTERETGELMTDRLNFLFLEMPNAGELVPEEGDSFAKKISWAFTHMSALRERPASLVEEVFEKIFEACKVSNLSAEEHDQYTTDIMTKWDYDDIINTAWWHGNSEGREEGRAEGREEGRAEGRLDMARRMKAMGLSSEVIAEASDFTVEEIAQL